MGNVAIGRALLSVSDKTGLADLGGKLAKAGVERFDPAGTPFDPNVAEAVGVVPVSDPARHDVVVEVTRPGYSLGERVIRPARVLVGRLLQ